MHLKKSHAGGAGDYGGRLASCCIMAKSRAGGWKVCQLTPNPAIYLAYYTALELKPASYHFNYDRKKIISNKRPTIIWFQLSRYFSVWFQHKSLCSVVDATAFSGFLSHDSAERHEVRTIHRAWGIFKVRILQITCIMLVTGCAVTIAMSVYTVMMSSFNVKKSLAPNKPSVHLWLASNKRSCHLKYANGKYTIL